jgi:hypothetical protein
MKVDQVTATLRYSAEVKGAWRSVELGAEATVAPDESWEQEQEQLYHQLGERLKLIWASGDKGQPADLSVPKSPVEAAPAPARKHWCGKHTVAFQRYEKGGHVWWTHRSTDGWCRES